LSKIELNMPGIARGALQDTAGGQIIGGSPNVFANGKPVVRVNDSIQSHGSGSHAAAKMAQGSGNVYTNNLPTSRAGDLATCQHTATGSSNVFANG